MRLVKKRKSIYTIGIICILFVICGGLYIKSKGIFILNKIDMTSSESDDYKSGFEETHYKNYKILHSKDVEPALLLVFAYLDELEAKSNELYGYISSKELVIQFDYDESVFLNRHKTSGAVSDVVGYYNPSTNTMYMNVKDIYHDIIFNGKKTRYEDGVLQGWGDSKFKSTFSHEYFHYIYSNFLEENNINIENLPIWFNEGISEYIGNEDVYADKDLDFISLRELNNSGDWEKNNTNNENTSAYMQSHYAIYKIINLRSSSVIKDIILGCKEKIFSESFENALGISLDEFEGNLKNNFSKDVKQSGWVTDIWANDHLDTKIKCLEDYIAYNEDDIRAYQLLGNYYKNNNGFNVAVDFLKKSIEKHPEEIKLWASLGSIYEENNMLDLSEECFDKVKELRK
ncbi:hypothetical protein [Clostridium intestinale]|uniref:tetratricopeptide repeat protein n=1 Tax=Clostridium intestinale TaxID=36845 RepID=UPI002DD65736|nr:hypothetical protein [Clostridium intestinale]WRY53668.1 hypothetical protein P8F83_10745 [Clostridium intestinale]